MKEGFDKEIDTLLRRRARGTAESFAEGGGADAHLDADELAAFAEGALPSAARVATAAHLADCDVCRGVVVTLTPALGGVAELKNVGAVSASSATVKQAAWRAWAASLFSPRSLRYAAPALALSVVAVVSFVALRSRQDGALQVARNESRRAEAPQGQTGAAAPATTEMANANLGGPVEGRPDAASQNANAAVVPPLVRGHGAGEAPIAAAGVAATDAPPPPPPPAPSPEGPAEVASAAPRPAAVEEPAPAKPESGDREKTARAAEEAEITSSDPALQQRRAAQTRANEMPDGARNQRRAADNNASNYGLSGGGAPAAPRDSGRGSAAAPAARTRRSTTRAERGVEDDEVARVGETRSAAGHRFRREGSAWVDVNYRPSMPSTGVRRGTEAFRALAADLPEIGRVAEQLSGEVVVVVRGRAYRIR